MTKFISVRASSNRLLNKEKMYALLVYVFVIVITDFNALVICLSNLML